MFRLVISGDIFCAVLQTAMNEVFLSPHPPGRSRAERIKKRQPKLIYSSYDMCKEKTKNLNGETAGKQTATTGTRMSPNKGFNEQSNVARFVHFSVVLYKTRM